MLRLLTSLGLLTDVISSVGEKKTIYLNFNRESVRPLGINEILEYELILGERTEEHTLLICIVELIM